MKPLVYYLLFEVNSLTILREWGPFIRVYGVKDEIIQLSPMTFGTNKFCKDVISCINRGGIRLKLFFTNGKYQFKSSGVSL